MFTRPHTDSTLWDWRDGQTRAERLAADLLQVEGFRDVDPQCPLGGPDDRKDILCCRDAKRWLAAVYFPPTRQDFGAVKAKFESDLEGVTRHQRDGFVFFTNQRLSPGERTDLAVIAGTHAVEIYHQERIRTVLDSPRGYGLRLEYLRIPMSEEEQHALWSAMKDDITTRLTRQEATLLDLSRKMDAMMARTMQIASDLRVQPSSLAAERLPPLTQFPTSDLQIGDLLWIHRLLCEEGMGHAQVGKFRTVSVWIGKPGSTPETATYVPPPPEKVEHLLSDLLSDWRSRFPSRTGDPESVRLRAITVFHHRFLAIHPFLDANGRVARALLQQQVLECLGRRFTARLGDEPSRYFDALSAADRGNFEPLEIFIKANIE